MKLKRSTMRLYSETKADKAFKNFTDQKRNVVERATNKALKLVNPDVPIRYEKDHHPVISSINMRTVRFHCPYTINDSAILSESGATRLQAYKTVVQSIRIPADAIIDWHIAPSSSLDDDICNLTTPDISGHMYHHVRKKYDLPDIISIWMNRYEGKKWFVRKHQIIAAIIGKDGKKVKHIRCKVKFSPGAVVADISEDTPTHDRERIFTVLYRSSISVEIGDKFMNQTGHKFTVCKILPDEEMPRINGKPAELIIPFELGKRATASSILEEIMSIVAEVAGEDIARSVIEVSKTAREIYTMARYTIWRYIRKMPYPGKINWNDQVFEAPYGLIRIYRMNNIPSEILKWTPHQVGHRRFSSRNGLKITWSMLFSLKLRGADKLTDWLLDLPYHDKEAVNTYQQTLECMNGTPPPEDSICIWKHLNNGTTGTMHVGLTGRPENLFSPDYRGSVLDGRIRVEGNFGHVITYPEDYNPDADNEKDQRILVRIPPHLCQPYVRDDDTFLVSKELRCLNTIIRCTDMYKATRKSSKGPANLARLQEALHEYDEQLANHLTHQIIKFNNPIIGECMYGTATGDPTLGCYQIGIPSKIYKRLTNINPMFKSRPLAMIFRQPVHDHCELAAMEVVPRDGNTIRMHPTVIVHFRGDFDGDCLSAVIPSDKKAYSDLDLIHISNDLGNDDYWSPMKLTNRFEELHTVEFEGPAWEREMAILTGDATTGISSWPAQWLYETPKPIWEMLWMHKLTDEFITNSSIEAGWNMGKIKIHTARAGGMSLSFLGWLHVRDTTLTKHGLRFYRFAAEDALASKNGGGNIVPDLFNAWKETRTNEDGNQMIPEKEEISLMIQQLVCSNGHPNLYDEYNEMTDLFYKYLIDKSKYQDVASFNASIHPIIGILRNVRNLEIVKEYVRMGQPRNLFA